MVGSEDALRAVVEPALISSGLELWDVEVSRDTVRLLVDRPGGVDLQALAAAAGQIVSPLLDEHPELTPAGQFSLEVSSPGVERTLRRLDQYARYVGTEVSIKTRVPIEGSRRHQGTLVSVNEEGIVLAPSDPPGRPAVEISHGDVDRARTVLVWGPAEKPGKKSTKAVKRPAADGRVLAGHPVASREKETE
jgi:ribosome maturation factor RimP